MHSVRLTEWLNANSSRAFPLVESGSLPQDLLVDARVMLFKDSPGTVTVEAVAIAAGTISITIWCGDSGYTVSAALSGSMYQRVFVATQAADIAFTLGPGASPSVTMSWTGVLELEPGCVLFPRLVRYMGAIDDIPVDPSNPTTEMEVFSSITMAPDFETPYLMDGDIKIEGGYGIQVSVSGNTIMLAAIPGYGDRLGYPCFKVHGDTSLAAAIAYVNGLTPDSFGNLDLESGDGIRLAPVVKDGVSYLYITSPVSPTKARCKKI